ncbi:chorismate mutase [Patescibacteria group bacterium]|nr:chorismate mutase [Patescibacteria group bacterium]
MDELLKNWRKQINKLDGELLNILAKRINIVREIGKHKKTYGIPSLDEKRWQEVLQSKLSKARSLNIPEKFIEKLYNLIHEHSLEIENKSK